jgi:hypothetical protein
MITFADLDLTGQAPSDAKTRCAKADQTLGSVVARPRSS